MKKTISTLLVTCAIIIKLSHYILEKYNTIWDKVSVDIKKELDSKPVYNKNYLKTKIESHADELQNFTIKNS